MGAKLASRRRCKVRSVRKTSSKLITDAWQRFGDDVRGILSGVQAQNRSTVRAADMAEETRGMLGRDTIEMSDR